MMWTLIAAGALGLGVGGGEARPPCRGRLLLLGDSNMTGALGQLLEARAAGRGLEVVRYARGGTGLARADRFDWVREAEEAMRAYPAEVVLMVLGGNDGQGVMVDDGHAHGGVQWGRRPYWEAAYRQRLSELFTCLSQNAREVFFLGPTNRGGRGTRARIARIRELQQTAAARFVNLHWIDSHAFTSDHQGRALRAGPDGRGEQRAYRQGDGVHLTWAGAAALLRALDPTLQHALDRACGGAAR